MQAMDENEFRKHADDAMAKLQRRVSAAGDDYGFDVDMSGGAMHVEFEDPPGKFVVSPNAPARQIWVSALSKSYKLTWDVVQGTFVHDGGDTLTQVLEKAISKHLHKEVEL